MNENANEFDEMKMSEREAAALNDIVALLVEKYGDMTMAEACILLQGIAAMCSTLGAVAELVPCRTQPMKVKDLYAVMQAVDQALGQAEEYSGGEEAPAR